MIWNEDEFFAFSFDEEGTRNAAMRDIENERIRISNLPLMRKAKQLYKLIHVLVDTFPQDDDLAYHYREIMKADTGQILIRISNAESCPVYTVRMENAVQIKIAAKNILSQTTGLRMLGLIDESYLHLLREELDDFRSLFVKWVSSFDRKTAVDDDWGLFC